MGCCEKSCCNKRRGRELPDGLDPCCSLKGPRCMCFPYDDAFMITAQVMPILALFISWIWYGTLIIGILGFIVYQVPWCCRQNRGGMLCSATVAMVIAIINLGLGIWIVVKLRESDYCEPFLLWYGGNKWERGYDGCGERTWGGIAIVCGLFWLTTALCVFYFVGSGRHAKWEKFHSNPARSDDDDDNNDNAGAVELGRVGVEEVEPVVVATAAAVMAPEIGKVDSTK